MSFVTLPGNLVDEVSHKKIDAELEKESETWKDVSEKILSSKKGISHMVKVCQSTNIMQMCGASINQVTSMYGRKNFENYIKRNIEEGNLLAVNTKKLMKYISHRGYNSQRRI